MQDDLLKATTATDITTLPPAQRAALVLESTKAEAQLRELVALSSDILEVKDKAGREQAHRAGMTLKTARVGIEKIGKAAREDAKNFSTAVIAEEKRLIGIVESEEARIFGLRDSFDAIEAARKAELERIEAERVRGIRAKIEQIKTLPHACLKDSAADLAATIADLAQLVPGIADFAEFCPDAAAARDTAVAALKTLHESAVARETEAARLAAERAELEALRAAQAERERQAAETKRQLDAQQAAIAAERQAEATRLQAERDALEAERRAFQEQQAAAAAGAAKPAAEPVQEAAPVTLGIDMGSGDTTATFEMSGSGPVIDLAAINEAAAAVELSSDKIDFTITPVEELTTSTTDDAYAVDGFRMMVTELLSTRSHDAIRELLESVLMELTGQKVAA